MKRRVAFFPFGILPGDPKTATIPLTQGKIALIDVADLPPIAAFKWHAARYRHNKNSEWIWYAKRVDTRTMRTVMMHRAILAEPKSLIDHQDGDGLNNRRSNLRLATTAQNGMNRRCQSGTSKYKGVYRAGNKWRAQFWTKGTSIKLGSFETEIEAAKAYDAKAFEFDPVFCRLNFPLTSLAL